MVAATEAWYGGRGRGSKISFIIVTLSAMMETITQIICNGRAYTKQMMTTKYLFILIRIHLLVFRTIHIHTRTQETNDGGTEHPQ